jgi:hypothetical protein
MRLRFERLRWEYEEFKVQLHEILVPFHEAAVTELQNFHSAKEEEIQEAIRNAESDEGEWQLQRDYARLEKTRAGERERLTGWLALGYLVSLLHFTLNRLKSALDSVYPPRGKYKGKSWLERLTNEYQGRFGIDLTSHHDFLYVRELVLARNAVEHNGGQPTEDYLEVCRPRFLRKLEKVEFFRLTEERVIVFSNRDFKESVQLVDKYMDWVVRELIRVHEGEIPTGPLRGSEFVP